MSQNQDKDTFNFFIPITSFQKSEGEGKDKKDGKRWIQGVASTDDLDLQGETVVQSGIDTGYFLEHGYFNDDHKAGPENKVGEPTECRITKAGLWVKGFLYKGKERADYWWEHLNSLEQSEATRKAGFSIQGKVMRRAGSSITKCWLQDIAITASPVNTSTWAEIVKSLSKERWCVHPWKSLEKSCKGCAGAELCKDDLCQEEVEKKALSAGGMGRVMIPQSLEGHNKVTTYKGIEKFTFDEAVTFLQISKGYSRASALAVADAIFTSQGLR